MTDTSWHTDDFPELRSGPPWVMQEMIAAQPELAERMLTDPSAVAAEIAEEIAAALAAGQPVTVTGCGTSEHAAHAVAALIASAVAPERRSLIHARPAFSAAGDPIDGLCLAISHDGGTRATALAAAAARTAGARTAAVTHHASSDVAAQADRVLVTPRHDDSWCHTIAYTSALLAGAAIAGRLGAITAQPNHARALLGRAIRIDAAPVAELLADRRVLLCAGAGLDHITARELALKVAEGARMPTVAIELETVLHGQLAGHEAADALFLVRSTTAGSPIVSPAAPTMSRVRPPPSGSRSPRCCRPGMTGRSRRSSRPPDVSCSTSPNPRCSTMASPRCWLAPAACKR